MVRAAISFFVLALFAYAFGAYGIAGISLEIGQTLLIIFLGLSVISFLVSILNSRVLPKL